MKVMQQRGFTIIEIMLFLGISGLLMVGILVGANAAISAQRYKDSVVTLQSDIQQQYEDATSIKNSRTGAGTAPGCTGSRGQTNCILMGKLMTIDANGAITQHTVYGIEPATMDPSFNENQVMQAYAPAVVPSLTQNSTMEWGTHIAWPVSGSGARPIGTARSIGILVIRSPQSGTVYTFTQDTTSTTNLSAVINDANRDRRTLCVAIPGWAAGTSGWATGDRMSITIANRAASANAVEVRTNVLMAGELQC